MARRLNLVTGALGFSGTHLMRLLLDAGERVVGLDLATALDSELACGTARATGLDLDHPLLELRPVDLLDPASMQDLATLAPSRVFHTASLYDYSAPLWLLRQVNVQGTRNLLAALESVELERFVHWSTCGVFGKPYTAADGSKVNLPFDEQASSPRNAGDGAPGPAGTKLVNAYSVSKWEQEQMMWRRHRQQALPLTVIRPAPIYGPGSAYGHGGIILAIAQGLLPAIPADARNFITTSVHVQDLARLALFVAERPQSLGQDYNVVDSSIISYAEFLQYIALLTGRRLRLLPLIRQRHLRPLMTAAAATWTWLERTFGLPRVRVMEVQSATYVSSSYWLSNRKSQAAGFVYDYPDVREGLRDTVAWMRHQGWLTDRRMLLGRAR